MDTLLMVAVVLIALAIVVQAGVLTAMYLLSRRLATKTETLMNESQAITSNLKTVSEDLSETGRIARDAVTDTMEEARRAVMRPIRQYSAFASAIAEGVRVFFAGRKTEVVETEIEITEERQHPAA